MQNFILKRTIFNFRQIYPWRCCQETAKCLLCHHPIIIQPPCHSWQCLRGSTGDSWRRPCQEPRRSVFCSSCLNSTRLSATDPVREYDSCQVMDWILVFHYEDRHPCTCPWYSPGVMWPGRYWGRWWSRRQSTGTSTCSVWTMPAGKSRGRKCNEKM